MESLELLLLCSFLFFVFILSISMVHLRRKLYVDKSKNEPILSETALVHAKSDHSWPRKRYDSFYVIHFYIANRDAVVDCEVPEKIWRSLEKGTHGTLCHRGGEFHSFQTADHLYRDRRVTGH